MFNCTCLRSGWAAAKSVKHVKGVTLKKKQCQILMNPQRVGNMSSTVTFQTPLVQFTVKRCPY